MRFLWILLIFLAGCGFSVSHTDRRKSKTVGRSPMRQIKANEGSQEKRTRLKDTDSGTMGPKKPQTDPFNQGPASGSQAEPPASPVRQTLPTRRPPLQLVDDATEANYVKLWPNFDSALRGLRDLYSELVWYDDAVVPRFHQVWDGSGRPGLVRAGESASANDEFPWNLAAGLREESNSKGVKFIRFGGPITWWMDSDRIRWAYSPHTTFGEILTVTSPTGFDYPFELRTRTKRENGTWRVNAFRPFPTEESLLEALASRGYNSSPADVQLLRIDSGHQQNRFVDRGWAARPPAMVSELVRSLLRDTPFQPALGVWWRDGDSAVASPTSGVDFSIVPKGFMGEFLPVEEASCMRCHQDAGHQVNLAGDQRWRLRGSDAIFSFSIFDPSNRRGQAPIFDRRLIEAGLLSRRSE